jgi:hypothetical protein
MHVGSIAVRVVQHLAIRQALGKPVQLTAKDIARRFHVPSGKGVRASMAVAIDAGYVINATGKTGKGHLCRYAAGPRLLADIEAARSE